jgi:hypothetical protein
LRAWPISQSKRDQQADDTQSELAPFVGEPPPTPEGESAADGRLALAAAGRRVDSLSKRKKLKARKTLKKRAAHPPSAARFVIRQLFML